MWQLVDSVLLLFIDYAEAAKQTYTHTICTSLQISTNVSRTMEDVNRSVTTQQTVINVFVVKDTFSHMTTELVKVPPLYYCRCHEVLCGVVI